MSRTSELEARRRALLTRCEEQRAELAYRLEQLRPSAQVAGWGARAPGLAANHPLAWPATESISLPWQTSSTTAFSSA